MAIKYFLALWVIILLMGHSRISNAQLPVDPSIAHGGAVIDTVGNHMTIINSPNTILDWQSFSIGSDNSVYFQQQDAASMVLNRVTGNDPSHIFGSLGSNGNIWLINPYGVLFGENARIDAAGLMASTMDISNIDFLAKKYHFNSTGIPAEIKNQGEIRTSLGGRVWLMGDRVQNEGLIQTPSGQTVIAAGKSVEFVDSGAPNVVVRVKAPENEVVNLGSLVAPSGQVDLHGSIVNQEGIVRANSVGSDGAGRIVLKADQTTLAKNSQTQADQGVVHMEVSSTLNNWGGISGKDITLTANEILQQGQVTAQGGNVTLVAKTSTYLDGSIDVSNAQGTGGNIRLTTNKLEGMAGGVLRADGEQGGRIQVEGRGVVAFSSTLAATGNKQGGTIEVTGDRVYLLNADVNASGGMQGGTVHLGGGWQGGGDLPHAREVLVGVGSEVKANGGTGVNAKGGEIAVWSTQSSEHYGSLQAKDGGRIEFSSQGAIRQTGDIQAGIGGTVLFDPKNLIITESPPDNVKLASTIASGSFPDVVLSSGDRFGSAIALDGDRLAIGAEGKDTVYLFTGASGDFSGGLAFQKKLATETGAVNMPKLGDWQFGGAIALEGDALAVGAYHAGAGFVGQVFLFNSAGGDFSRLTYTHTLTSPNPQSDEGFGKSVALDGNHLAVGAWGRDAGTFAATNQGAVYLYTDQSDLHFSEPPTLIRMLTEGDPIFNGSSLGSQARFGNSIALDGDRLVVGATNWIAGASGTGTVYLFTGATNDFANLTLRQKLTDVDTTPITPNAAFGVSVALNGNRLAVGEAWKNNFAGVLHVFTVQEEFSGWTWQKTLNGSSGLFGTAIALDGDRMAVGSIFQDNVAGAVSLYTGLSSVGSTIGIQDAIFDINPAGDSYITPATITGVLNAGSDVVLQANNDITVQSAINVNGGGSASGNLTLQAGRNITFDAGITTDNGNLTAIAGDPDADQSNRDPGTPTLTIADGVTLSVGSGIATLAAIKGNFVNKNENIDAAISIAPDCCGGGSGRWLIYANAPTSSDRNGFSASEYSKHYNQPFVRDSVSHVPLVPQYAGIGNWFFYSIAPELKVNAPGPINLTYGDTYNIVPTPAEWAALITGYIDNDTFGDIEADDQSTLWNISGTLSTTGNITAGIHDVSYAGGLFNNLGYEFVDNTASVNELTVAAKPITATSFTASDKTYDGNTSATITGGELTGRVSSGGEFPVTDDVSLSGIGTFDNKNAGIDKTVTLTSSSLVGADSGNYILDPASSGSVTDLATIAPLALNIGIANIVADDKTYDRTTSAIVKGSLINFISNDLVLLTGTGVFDSKDAGNDKTVTFSRNDLTLAGTDSINYLLQPDFENGTTAADIFKKDLSAGGFAVENKIYDGNTNATLVANSGIPQGVIDGDSVSFSSSAATFDNKNVGTGKTVTITGITLTGTDSINYQLSTNNSATALADITAKDLTLSNLIAEDKVYDGNVNAIVNGTLVGRIDGDEVSLVSGAGTFDNKNVGGDKVVTVTAGTLAGPDSNNYILGNIGDLTTVGDITPKSVTVGITAEDKVYDGNSNARVTGSLTGLVPGDTVSVTGTGFFDNKDVGINKTVTVNNFSLGGVDSSNYQVSGNGGTALADIIKAFLTYRADEAIKTSGEPITGLTGKVIGFVAGENQFNATSGELTWSTPATRDSPEGKYPIIGGGLSARNYELIQHPNNATALQLAALVVTPSLKQVASDTSVQAVNTAVSGATSAADVGGTGRVIDATSSAAAASATGSFGRLSLAQMSFAEMQQLIDFRKEFKENLFSDAVSKLEVDPKLSDVMVCTSTRKEDLNTCRITEEQRKEIKSQLAGEQQQQRKHKSIHKVRIASLPQITRKIVVLFGVDQYVDKTIPSLESAISDTEAIGQLFADKLGYETRIVKNATRADIIRTLNELAIEMDANDSLVVYYAGHGYMNQKTGNGYWIPSDASSKDPQSWISNTSISEMLGSISSKQLVMISDSCYSGAFTKEQKVGLNTKDAKPDDILGKRSVVVMASGGDEPVADEGRGGHSIFAWFLMQALQNVDNWKIGTNIFEQIQNDVKKSFPQVPQYGAAVSAGHQEGGDYLFEFRQLESIGN